MRTNIGTDHTHTHSHATQSWYTRRKLFSVFFSCFAVANIQRWTRVKNNIVKFCMWYLDVRGWGYDETSAEHTHTHTLTSTTKKKQKKAKKKYGWKRTSNTTTTTICFVHENDPTCALCALCSSTLQCCVCEDTESLAFSRCLSSPV